MVRSPRFEPGSSAWQADVLDQTRLRPHSDTQDSNPLIKPIPPEIDARIANTLITIRNNGITTKVVKEIDYRLRQLVRNCNLLDPESVKAYIATAKTKKTKQPIAEETKNRYAYTYDKFCKTNQIQWQKPYYKVEEKTPLIPTRDNVNAIINNASKRYVPIFTIIAEIGAEGHELENVTQNDIDAEQGIIRIRGCKGHASGTYKLKTPTAESARARDRTHF